MSPYWQNYWFQLMYSDDRNPGWVPLHRGPLDQVPNKYLVTHSLIDFALALLDDAEDEVDYVSGDIRVDCYTEPTPAPGTPPFFSSETREVRVAR